MKLNRPIKANLRRGAFYLLLLLAVCVIQFALALAAAPASNQIEQKSAPAGIAVQNTHRRAIKSDLCQLFKPTHRPGQRRLGLSFTMS